MTETEKVKEAAEHALRPQTRFGWLKKGALFRFAGSEEIQVKTSARGYKTQGIGKTWGTSQMTAVIPIGTVAVERYVIEKI